MPNAQVRPIGAAKSAVAGVEIDPPLPHNLDAERCVLGAVLVDGSLDARPSDGSALDRAPALAPEDFFAEAHRVIFRRMLELAAAGQPIDAITLVERLRRHGELELAGGVAAIAALGDGIPRVMHLEHYVGIVREKSQLRRLIHAAHEMQQCAFDAEEPPFAILGRARLALAELDTQQDSAEIFDNWEEFQNAKPLRALIDGFLWADVANAIGGLSTEGKTLILLATVKALLSGRPLFGHFRVAEPLERCVYLIPECARGPFWSRLRLFGLEDYVKSGRLLVRTLTKGPRVELDDPRLLRSVRDASVTIDTAVRYAEGDESSATDTAHGLAASVFGLLSAGAACVHIAQHSPKSFARERFISLENCLRGSGDFGAFVGAGFGIRQIDKLQNIIHLEDIKPRDSEPAEPFQIIGRPWIDREGDFRMHRAPGTCGRLADYLDEVAGQNRGGPSEAAKEAKAANLELLRNWLCEDPNQSSEEMAARFREHDVELSPITIRRYKQQLRNRRPL